MDAVQERQLVLMEKMNRRLDAIQEGQKKLEEANATLRNENSELTQQDGWKTQDGRMAKNCRARLCIPDLTRHFFVILPS